ncbi:MAG: nucleotidyl transferase AbiEii/AbiGii toxin family protein [Bacteroidota bacterium]
MNEFATLDPEQRLNVFTQTAARTGLPAFAIEKDWWVTQLLRIVFDLPDAEVFVFKGGTSLSKGYDLIQRFSEDIDLAVDRAFFDRAGELSKGQLRRLRKASAKFISSKFLDDVKASIEKQGLPISSIGVEHYESSQADPIRVYITYEPLTQKSDYLPPRILLEISCRSLREPCEDVPVQSLVDSNFKGQSFAQPPFSVRIVEPKRTFLEKICLLHEEWQKDTIRVERLSRHLYDLERLMDTDHGKEALKDGGLFYHIVGHRRAFTPIKGVDYDGHKPELIRIVPPDRMIGNYEADYKNMQESMFAGESLSWKELVKRLELLQKRINNLDW